MRLERLHTEDRFVVNGRVGTLLYSSESRARVRWDKTEAELACDADIASGTEVDPWPLRCQQKVGLT